MRNAKRYLSLKETARMLGMTPQGLQLLTSKGMMPSTRNRAGMQVYETAAIKQYQQKQKILIDEHYFHYKTAR